MSQQEQSRSDEEIYDMLLSEHGETRDVVVETKHGEMEFTVTEPSRTTRNRVQSALPDRMFDAVSDLGIDEGTDPDDVMDEIELEEVDLQALTMDEEATEAWNDLVIESLKHDRFQQEEIIPLVDKFNDDVWYGVGGIALELGATGGAINGFREK